MAATDAGHNRGLFKIGGGSREQQRAFQPRLFRRPPDISDHQGQFSEPCQNRAAV